MIRVSYLWICLIVLASACGSSEKETPSGFKYTVIKAGNGAAAKPNDIIVFNFELRDNKDSVWNDSYKMDMPAAIQIPDTAQTKRVDPVTEMISLLKVGDSVKTTLTIADFFSKLVGAPVPQGVDTTGSVTYRIQIKDAMSLKDFVTWRKKTITDRDEKMITDYIKKNNLKAERDTSGLYYVMHYTTGGPKPTADNCVELKYVGKFLNNGQPFDSNERIAFSLNQVITGWKRAIPMLGKGDSATFFIPSRLGYGDRGYYGIPPDAVLMFDVTLYDYKDTFDASTRTCK
jgi:FKBP-type peptidyl-prolyl cis-trans isomerase FkpA